MARPKGSPKLGGRKKGTTNKDVAPIREKFQQLLDSYPIELMMKDLKSLEAVERLRIVTGLAEFIVPKLQRSEIKGEVETKEVQTFTMFGRKIVF
jgi:hypothetical protein